MSDTPMKPLHVLSSDQVPTLRAMNRVKLVMDLCRHLHLPVKTSMEELEALEAKFQVKL